MLWGVSINDAPGEDFPAGALAILEHTRRNG
jgi:hypothetical protein